MSKYEEEAARLGKLVTEKNAAYGSSFEKTGDFLMLLYPGGIKPEQFNDALAVVRVFDKLMRIANKKDAFGESPWSDVAGYGLLMSTEESVNNRGNRCGTLPGPSFVEKGSTINEPAPSNMQCEACLRSITVDTSGRVRMAGGLSSSWKYLCLDHYQVCSREIDTGHCVPFVVWNAWIGAARKQYARDDPSDGK